MKKRAFALIELVSLLPAVVVIIVVTFVTVNKGLEAQKQAIRVTSITETLQQFMAVVSEDMLAARAVELTESDGAQRLTIATARGNISYASTENRWVRTTEASHDWPQTIREFACEQLTVRFEREEVGADGGVLWLLVDVANPGVIGQDRKPAKPGKLVENSRVALAMPLPEVSR